VKTRNDGTSGMAHIGVTVYDPYDDPCNLPWKTYSYSEGQTRTITFQYVVPDTEGSYDISARAWATEIGSCSEQCCPDGLLEDPHNEGKRDYEEFEVSGGDSDGDGIANEEDNCPNTPNGPNLGTCTITSFSEMNKFGEECTRNSQCATSGFRGYCSMNQSDDYDEDGIGDACDVCPYYPSLNQNDADGDGIGDECEVSPDKINRGTDICSMINDHELHTAFFPGPNYIHWIRRDYYVGGGGCMGRCGGGCPSSIISPIDCHETNRYSQACLNHDACVNYYENIDEPVCNKIFVTEARSDCYNEDLECPDADEDGLPDRYEDKNHNGIYEPELGETNPYDDDTDEDGRCDGNAKITGVVGRFANNESGEDLNFNGIVDSSETNPNNPDTDSDGIYDGTESGLTEPAANDTDLSAGFFIPDADPSTRTDPTNPDTDGDGLLDGEEDTNHNGAVDESESDPGNIVDITTTTTRKSTTTTTRKSTTTTSKPCICPPLCIFGENSEEVELLRYFRDNVLSQTPEGRELIKLYYQWSPVIVNAMEEDGEFKEDVKEMIDGVLPIIKGAVK